MFIPFSPKHRLWFATPVKNSWRRNVLYFIFLNHHQRVCLLILKKEEKRERERQRDRERQRQRERERNINQLPPVHAPSRYQIHNLGMCPGQELNLQPSGVHRTMLQPTEPPKEGRNILYFANFATSCFLCPTNCESFFLLPWGCQEAITVSVFSESSSWFRLPHFKLERLVAALLEWFYPLMPTEDLLGFQCHCHDLIPLSKNNDYHCVILVNHCKSRGRWQCQCASGYFKD